MKESNEPLNAQSTAVESEAKVENGFGACSSSGCNCPAFGGSGDLCSNCGHNYGTHW